MLYHGAEIVGYAHIFQEANAYTIKTQIIKAAQNKESQYLLLLKKWAAIK